MSLRCPLCRRDARDERHAPARIEMIEAIVDFDLWARQSAFDAEPPRVWCGRKSEYARTEVK